MSKRPAESDIGDADNGDEHVNGTAVKKAATVDIDSTIRQNSTEANTKNKQDKQDPRSFNCPYLDTIKREVLDFDFEKLCSVSLSKINCYACLVCGKFFQGRGIGTHAHTHSLSDFHHVFLNLGTFKFYCLPDNYQVIDSSLEDIIFVLKPTFTRKDIEKLENNPNKSIAYDGTTYYPGCVGLNNIKANDYCNVVLQAMSNVRDIHRFFLRAHAFDEKLAVSASDILVQRFGELMRKIWNPRNFKSHVSPHEMLQAVVLASNKTFQITVQSDPIKFLGWFINALNQNKNLRYKDKDGKSTSVLYDTFQGKMKVFSRKVVPVTATDNERAELLKTEEYQEKMSESNFIYLTLDLPSNPLFKDEMVDNIIPQIAISQLLMKYNGVKSTEYQAYDGAFMKRFVITKLPRYLILYVKRFTANTFFVEKNPTIVNFPINNVNLGDLLEPVAGQETTPELVYDLIANIVHEGEHNKGTYKVHILHKGTGKWFDMQDLMVSEILPQMITLSESYIQIWEQRC